MQAKYMILFFTRGVSLEQWINQGLYDREKLIYEEHLNENHFEKIYWFTYGSDDRKLSIQLKKENRLHKDIEVIQMPKIFNIPKIGSFLYSFVLPFLYPMIFKNTNILKTNQMDGSWSALLVKKIYNKKLLLRTGYTWSKLKEVTEPNNKLKIKLIKFIENMMYKNSDLSIVASNNSKQYIKEQYGIENVNVLYNYIDLNKFFNFQLKREKDSIVYIGRLSEEKNIFNLIKASNLSGLKLKIYGSGPLEHQLDKYIKDNLFDAKLMGTVANDKIPNILNSNKYYALVSYQEGMPKSLMEAMACGSICIGTNTDGINELIKDGSNGYLANGFDANDIKVAIVNSMNDNDDILVNNAVEFAKEYFDINKIVQNEYKILEN